MHEWFDRQEEKNTFELHFWFTSTEGKIVLRQGTVIIIKWTEFHSSSISDWQIPLVILFRSLFTSKILRQRMPSKCNKVQNLIIKLPFPFYGPKHMHTEHINQFHFARNKIHFLGRSRRLYLKKLFCEFFFRVFLKFFFATHKIQLKNALNKTHIFRYFVLWYYSVVYSCTVHIQQIHRKHK